MFLLNMEAEGLLPGIETSESDDFVSPCHILSLDATKCFDRIRPVDALEYGRQFGMSIHVLVGLSSYLLQHQRQLSANGYSMPQCGTHWEACCKVMH